MTNLFTTTQYVVFISHFPTIIVGAFNPLKVTRFTITVAHTTSYNLLYIPLDHNAPLLKTAVCMYMYCVVGVVCSVKAYNLVVDKNWKRPAACGFGGTQLAHSQQTIAMFLRSAKRRRLMKEPCGTPRLTGLTKTSWKPIRELFLNYLFHYILILKVI